MSDDGTLDDLYIEWLYRNFVGPVANRNPNSSYWKLAKQIYTMPFTWSVRNDKNRAEDGKELRQEFITDCDIEDIEINWLQIDCSVLEMLIGLARRASFETGEVAGDWLWKFFVNLDLHIYNDRVYDSIAMGEVDAIIQRLLDRTYETNGALGLFPLKNARNNQTQVELWYQLQAYLIERDFADFQ